MAHKNHLKLAVLMDADNTHVSVIQEPRSEMSRYGTATINRAYADRTKTILKSLVLFTIRNDAIERVDIGIPSSVKQSPRDLDTAYCRFAWTGESDGLAVKQNNSRS